MAEWPELDELKQKLDVTDDAWNGDDDDTRLSRLLASAIARVKLDVGMWDEADDEPDEMLAEAALRMAELLAARPSASDEGRDARLLSQRVVADPTYQRLLFGHRRRFGIA